MNFVNPIWLWGLLALLIPLIIHLWSRQKTRILPFGSLRFLKESSSTQSRSIQLTDSGLMLLRMLLFILLVIFIVQFNWNPKIQNEKWLILGDSIQTPNAYLNEGFKIYPIKELKNTPDYLNQWYFLQELSQNYPEIDSLVWIDYFENDDFWGAVPPLSFSFELVNKADYSQKESLSFNRPDTVFYSFKELEEEYRSVIDKILKSNELYLNEQVVFTEEKDGNTMILFSNKVQEDVPLQFIIEGSKIHSSGVVENWPYKTAYISEIYLKDKRLHDELLLLISEQIAQYLIPEWHYNDWQQATQIEREKLDKAQISNSVQSNNEWLFWIIVALFLLERIWVYQKRNG